MDYPPIYLFFAFFRWWKGIYIYICSSNSYTTLLLRDFTIRIVIEYLTLKFYFKNLTDFASNKLPNLQEKYYKQLLDKLKEEYDYTLVDVSDNYQQVVNEFPSLFDVMQILHDDIKRSFNESLRLNAVNEWNYYQNFSTSEYRCDSPDLSKIRVYKILTLAVAILLGLLIMAYIFVYNFFQMNILCQIDCKKQS